MGCWPARSGIPENTAFEAIVIYLDSCFPPLEILEHGIHRHVECGGERICNWLDLCVAPSSIRHLFGKVRSTVLFIK